MSPSPRPARPPAALPRLTLERPHLVVSAGENGIGPLAWQLGELVYPQAVGIGIPAHRPIVPSGSDRPVAGASPFLLYQIDFPRFGGVRVGADLAADGTPLGNHVSAWVLPGVHRDLIGCLAGCPQSWAWMRHTQRGSLALQRLTWMLHGLAATVYRIMPGAWGGRCPALDAWVADFDFADELATGIRSRSVDLRNPDTW